MSKYEDKGKGVPAATSKSVGILFPEKTLDEIVELSNGQSRSEFVREAVKKEIKVRKNK